MVRAACCDKTSLRKGPWAPEEDRILISYIKKNGHGNWRALPNKAGLLRCGKSCRLRWMNYLNPDIKRGNFTKEEEDNIIHLHEILGNRWSAIAARLPGRTDNEIKNIWHTHLKKRLNNYQPPQSFKRHSRKINQTKNLVHTPNSPQISSSKMSNLTDGSPFSSVIPDVTIDDQIMVKLEEMNTLEYFIDIDESFWTNKLAIDNDDFDFVSTMDGEEFQSLDMLNSTTIMEDDMDFLFNFFIKTDDFSELPKL
ncbi:unnamed protein product [Withania somnifera]